MIMFNYIFPIFAFGLVMTGIVFLGLQQASDLAKNLAAEQREAENKFKTAAASPLELAPCPLNVPTNKNRP